MTTAVTRCAARCLFAVMSVFSCCSWAQPTAQPALQQPRPLRPQDFLHAAPMAIDGSAAIYQAILPLAVYQGTLRSDLGDLRVFNAQGEIVPHAVRRIAATSSRPLAPLTLPHFPLYAESARDPAALRLRVRTDASGTIVDLAADAPGATKKPQQLTAYLLDASAVQRPLQSLEISWKGTPSAFTGTLQVEASDDLANWRSVISAPVSYLEFQGHRLEQRSIELPQLRAKYLRLSWPQQQTAVEFASVSAEPAALHTETPRAWISTQGRLQPSQSDEYAFDLGAHAPVDRLRVDLPQINTLVEARLFTRASLQAQWQWVADSVLYRLSNAGQELRSADIVINTHSTRYWLLKVDQTGGGIGQGAPKLHAGWIPNQLLFVARGGAPFQIAYGAAKVPPAEVAIDRLLLGYQADGPLQAKLAEVGVSIGIAPQATAPLKAQLPWKKYLLWAILVLAVALLGWMAYRLARQLESNKGSS
jgi:hypothetical protein